MSEPDLVEVPELTFPVGLPGFADLRRFGLSRWGGEDSPYARLNSLEDPAVAFLVAPPEAFFDDYDVALSDEDAEVLQLQDPADALVLVVITVGEQGRRGHRQPAGARSSSTLRERSGMQVVLRDRDRSTRVPLRAA